jgi:hypothetical protein
MSKLFEKAVKNLSPEALIRFKAITNREIGNLFDVLLAFYISGVDLSKDVQELEKGKPWWNEECEENCSGCDPTVKAACFSAALNSNEGKIKDDKELSIVLEGLKVPQKILKGKLRLKLFEDNPNAATFRNNTFDCPNDCDTCAVCVRHYCDTVLTGNLPEGSFTEKDFEEIDAYDRLTLGLFNLLRK